jgi:hypothetical protein
MMRQTQIVGERLFVDFAGRAGEVVDGLAGEAIVGASATAARIGSRALSISEWARIDASQARSWRRWILPVPDRS